MDDDQRATTERDAAEDGEEKAEAADADTPEDADDAADRDLIDERERDALLRRVQRQSSTIGAKIPETVDVGGDELRLAEFVIETRRVPGVPEEAEETLAAAKQTLATERKARLERLESEPLTSEEAQHLADEIVGFDRALNALRNLRRPRYGEASDEQRVRDYKQWLGFLGDVTD